MRIIKLLRHMTKIVSWVGKLYNASKACAELVCSCYANIYKNEDKDICLATVRAGNVIGGGDWSKDRIIPDIVKANFSNEN